MSKTLVPGNVVKNSFGELRAGVVVKVEQRYGDEYVHVQMGDVHSSGHPSCYVRMVDESLLLKALAERDALQAKLDHEADRVG